MDDLSKLPNIGKELKSQLNQIGVNTKEQLAALGGKQAWLNIKAIDHSACYNRLCALEGVIQNIRWHNFSVETKKSLKNFMRLSNFNHF